MLVTNYLDPYSGAEVLKRRRQRNAGAITEFPVLPPWLAEALKVQEQYSVKAGLNIKEKNHVE